MSNSRERDTSGILGHVGDTARTAHTSGRRSFESVRVTEDGRERPLVEGTTVRVTVHEDGGVSASAGCNGMRLMGGLVDGHLEGPATMTLKSCGPERDAQDRWLAGVLGSRPTWVERDDRVELTSGATTIELVAGG